MAFDALTGYMSAGFNASATKNAPSSGLNLPGTTNSPTVNFKVPIVLGGNLANGANECWQLILTAAASGSVTLNLQSLTDLLNASGVALARVKAFLFCLLGTSEDSVNGTACSQVTIGNAGTNPNQLDLGGTTMTRTLLNGDVTMYASRQAAGRTVSGTACNVLLQNNDASNSMAVYSSGFGATT